MSDVSTSSSAGPATSTAGDVRPLLQVRHLVKNFPIRSGGLVSRVVAQIQAVSDISFDILPGQTLGLVGESGCGKSTTGRAVLNLQPATSGSVIFDG